MRACTVQKGVLNQRVPGSVHLDFIARSEIRSHVLLEPTVLVMVTGIPYLVHREDLALWWLLPSAQPALKDIYAQDLVVSILPYALLAMCAVKII